MKHALFVGLASVDFIKLVEEPPGENQKIVGLDQVICAGGPATNAAVAYAALAGCPVKLATCAGQGNLRPVLVDELADHGVEVLDCTDYHLAGANDTYWSTIQVKRANGDRSVVSGPGSLQPDPAVLQAQLDSGQLKPSVVFIDGHYPALAQVALRWARSHRVPTVFDGGSWKPGTEQLLPQVDLAIVSANFQVPAAVLPPEFECDLGPEFGLELELCASIRSICSVPNASTTATSDLTGGPAEVLQVLGRWGVRWAVQTRGAQDILYADWSTGTGTSIDTWGSVPTVLVTPVCTLGAGDFFHGAAAYYWQKNPAISLPELCEQAAQVAALSVQSFGPRAWLAALNP